ncbi:MAG: PKD domain-containing protein, partial [Bacteroidota bacterium]
SYTLTYTVTQLGINYSDQVTASVNALPVVTMDPIPSLCVGATAITLSGGSSSSVGTGVYTVNGVTATTFNPTTAGSFNVTYTFTDANGCSASASTSLVVNAPDAVSISASNDTISVGGSVTLTATNIAGASYSWSDGSASVGSGQIIVASPASNTNYSVNVTNPVTGCISTASKTITVLSAPSVDAGNDTSICQGSANLSLSGSPSGGTWSGAGVTNNAGVYSFSPSSAGVGSHILTYTVIQLGINYSDQVTASVNALPVVTMAPILGLCVGATAITLNGGSPTTGGTGVYTVNGVTATTFNPTTAGSFNVTYTFTDANGCSASASTSLVVNAPDTVSISAPN